MRQFSEYCVCPTEGCGAVHAPGAPSQIHARLAKTPEGQRVMRRLCVRCRNTWDESLDGFVIFDKMPGEG